MSFFNETITEGGMFNNGFGNFEYRVSKGDAPFQGEWGIENGFKYEIAIFDGSVRFANIKKTVAYVCIGEDDDGKPIVEKWKIKQIWTNEK